MQRGQVTPDAPGNALAVIGMRRTGKTWYCYQKMQDLLEAGIPRERELRGLRSAMEQLGCPRGTIVTWRDESGLVPDRDIDVQPAWRFALAETPVRKAG